MTDEAGFWELVREGTLAFCRCGVCGHAWLPPSPECPRCLAADAVFEAASGRAELLSWVVFHKAYQDSAKGRVPYVVGLVQLAEGPRITTNILQENGEPGSGLHAGQRLALRMDGEGDTLRPCFVGQAA